MKRSLAADILPMALVVTGVVALMHLWLTADAAVGLEERVPLASNVDESSTNETGDILAQAEHQSFDGTPADLPGAWPQFRGKNLDAIATDPVTLARDWPDEGPLVLWSVDLGEGYAGAAVLNGRVYIADYDQEKRGDAIRCF